MGWNFGDILDAVEPVLPPDAPALIHDGRIVTWGEASAASNNLARSFVEGGAKPGAKIAFYMRNRPEYMIGIAAGLKARLVHVNVNYRYTPNEVWYIFDNSDAELVIFAPEFRDAVAEIRPRLPNVKRWIEATEGEAASFAERFSDLTKGDGAPLNVERSGDDLFFLYTGGTTGMPKGVMWTQNDMRELTLAVLRKVGPVPESLEELRHAIRTVGPGARTLIGPPLMHGTGLLSALNAYCNGGCIITLAKDSFDGAEMAQAAHDHKAQAIVIVGDSFGRPLLDTLNAAPGKYDLSGVMHMTSSGVMWSVEVKRGLLEHMPAAILNDVFASSEAVGLGGSLMMRGAEMQTAKFMLGDRCRVFDENDAPVAPGSDKLGLVAVGPPNPLGYYKDEAKSAHTFRVINGVRYSIPGDWCMVEADGTLRLMGRGNACINTAGEKVFSEEVEEALKTHASIEDALVIGLPDPKWGQAVTGVVRLRASASLDESALIAHVRNALAAYKAPKRIFATSETLRTSNGKADYVTARRVAEEAR